MEFTASKYMKFNVALLMTHKFQSLSAASTCTELKFIITKEKTELHLLGKKKSFQKRNKNKNVFIF